MFKYNELSDLKNGSLVTPLSKEDDGTILCLNQNGEKVYFTFKDFDFSKKVEDRKPEEDIKSEEILPPEEDIKPEQDPTIQDVIDEMEKDDADYDGTDQEDDTEVFPDNPLNPEDPPIIDDIPDGFLNEEDARKIINKTGLVDPSLKYDVWKDSVRSIK